MKINKHKAGFTLFEMLISAAIVVLISGVVLYNHKKFSSDIEVTNLAYKMAIDIRQAQVYSISVKEFVSGQSTVSSFEVPYGLHFDNSYPTSYIIFADADGNGLYTGSGVANMDCSPPECVEKITIGRGNTIEKWCGVVWGNPGAGSCVIAGVDKYFLDMKFFRPNPDAIFRLFSRSYNTGGAVSGSCGGMDCTGWATCLISPSGRKKAVVVYETGQISVEDVVNGHACY